MSVIAYVKIKFISHTYTATLHNTDQLEEFLSRKDEKFEIVETELVDAKYGHAIAAMLNRISRFGNSLNKTAVI